MWRSGARRRVLLLCQLITLPVLCSRELALLGSAINTHAPHQTLYRTYHALAKALHPDTRPGAIRRCSGQASAKLRAAREWGQPLRCSSGRADELELWTFRLCWLDPCLTSRRRYAGRAQQHSEEQRLEVCILSVFIGTASTCWRRRGERVPLDIGSAPWHARAERRLWRL